MATFRLVPEPSRETLLTHRGCGGVLGRYVLPLQPGSILTAQFIVPPMGPRPKADDWALLRCMRCRKLVAMDGIAHEPL
jgi:hypothetical protein